MRGVTWNRNNRRWRASFRRKYLGEFLTEQEAEAVRRGAEVAFDGAEHDHAVAKLEGADAHVPIFDRKGQVTCWAVVDAGDLPLVQGHRWSRTRSGYAVARIGGRITYLHRLLVPGSPVADHRDRDRLNNRRANLRPCSVVENSRNSRLAENNSSGFKGVSRTRDGLRWRARITADRREIHLGCFTTQADAAVAYDEAALRLHGHFASPNSPGEKPELRIVVRPAPPSLRSTA